MRHRVGIQHGAIKKIGTGQTIKPSIVKSLPRTRLFFNKQGGKGKRDGNVKGGEGLYTHNPMHYAISRLMKAMGKDGSKGAGKRTYNSRKGASQSPGKGGGCHNCGQKGHIVSNLPQPKVDHWKCSRCGRAGHLPSQSRVPAREVTQDEDNH